MPSLMDFSDELLEQIVFHVADQDRLALYRDVVYVNKTLSRIASPHVARHSPIHCMNPYAPPTPTHVLLLHLFQHPEQAKNVRTLIADSDEGCKIHLRDWRAYCESFTGSESFGRIADVAKETCPALASSSDWCHKLGKGSVDASMALLLALCTRIVRLDYRLHFFFPDIMQNMTLRLITLAVKDMMAETKPSLHPLAQLQHAVLRAPSTHSFPWCHIVYVAPFFYLPKLKFLATADMGTGGGPLRDVHDDEPSWVQGGSRRVVLDPDLYISHFPVGTSPIETLILDRACFTSSGFLVLVRACKRIKRLVICIDRYMNLDNREVAWQEDNNRVVANLEDLSKAIAYHSSSLEEVTFGLMYESNWEDYRHYHMTTAPLALYDCLKNMQRLKRLTIHIEFLYRKVTPTNWDAEIELVIDRLPPTLEHLVLERHHYVDATVTAMEMKHYRTLLGQCGPGGRFSKLQSLDVPLCYERSRGFRFFEEAEELEILAASNGVQVIFRRDPTDYFVPQVPKPYPPLQQYRRE